MLRFSVRSAVHVLLRDGGRNFSASGCKTKEKVGFIGLGQMGARMAANLVKKVSTSFWSLDTHDFLFLIAQRPVDLLSQGNRSWSTT